MGKIGLIIWREFITRVRKPSFLIMTLLGPLLIGGLIAGVVFFALQDTGITHVLVIDNARIFSDRLKGSDQVTFFVDQQQWSDSAFKESPYGVMVDVNDDVLVNNTIQLYYKDLPSLTTQRVIQAELEKVIEREKLRLNEVDPEIYARIKTALKVHLFDIDKSGKRSLDEQKAIVGVMFSLLIYVFIFMYGVQVMRGVMEEKTNRIVEVLISSVKPFQLMMGKIIGIALVGLTQFLLWILLTALISSVASTTLMAGRLDGDKLAKMQTTAQLQQLAEENPQAMAAAQDEGLQLITEIISELPRIIPMFIFYFLGGYLLYSALFAAIGAAVDSETDTQQFMLPVTVPMIVAILIAELAMTNPEGPAVFWASLVPFTSPIVMMIRVVTGNAFEHPMELIGSMALLVITFIGTTWVAARIYRTGILMYGKKVNWKELGKWLFYKA